jgi:hypothetical protein
MKRAAIFACFLIVSTAFSQGDYEGTEEDYYATDEYYDAGRYAARDAVSKEEKNSGGGLSWQGWTRIAAFTGTAVFSGLAIASHADVNKKIKDLNDMTMGELQKLPEGEKLSAAWYNENWEPKFKDIRSKEKTRNIYAGIAGGLAAIGIATFFINF